MQSIKPLRWVAMPDEVQQVFGFALFQAQSGSMHMAAKPLKGFGSSGVVDVVEDWRGNAYRAIYTVRFAGVVYVLHCFEKKSKRGIETPKREMDLIHERLQIAVAMDREGKK